MKAWLKHALTSEETSIRHAVLFGSVLSSTSPRDVDVAILLYARDASTIEGQVKVFRTVKAEFLRSFDMPLHVSIFSAREHRAYKAFLGRIGFQEALL